MCYYEKISLKDYYLPKEIACPDCKMNEKNTSNPYDLCDDCTVVFDREFQQDVEREAEEWLRSNK